MCPPNYLEPELARAILNEMVAFRGAVSEQSKAIRELEVTVGQQTVMLTDRAATCPHRVEIARAGNNLARLAGSENAIADNAHSIDALKEDVSDMKAHPKANVVVKDGPNITVDWKAVGGMLVILGAIAGGACKALGIF